MSHKVKAKCPRCGYEWKTKSKLNLVSCPSCERKFPNPRLEEHTVLMEHFNLDESGVKILDRKLNWIVDVHFRRDRAYCTYDKSSNCHHVKFALSLPEVQKILKKKGWNIEGLTR